jgi:hypothetical protein
MNPFGSLLICVAGWMNRNQQEVIEYVQEEIRVLREQLDKKPRFNDAQRTHLATKAKQIGRKALNRFATLVTPETLLACPGLWAMTVAGQLHPVGQTAFQIVNKPISIRCVALPNMPTWNQFAVGINGNPCPSISNPIFVMFETLNDRGLERFN